MERYDPKTIEAKWQRVWADAARLRGREPDPASARPEELRARDAPVPVGDAAHGAHARLHDRRRRHALPRAQRHARAPSAGVRLVRPAGRERGDPRGRPSAREHRAQHRPHHALVCGASAGRTTGIASLSTHEPAYYRWQQWQFLRFLERGLAYRKGAPVKWCPNDQTVLANEQVLADGTCERCGAEVESRLHGAVVLPDHRLRAGAARRPRDGRTGPSRSRRGSATGSGAPRAPRSSSGSRSWDEDVAVFTTRPGHAVRRDVLRPRARARARRADRVRATSATTCAARARRRPRSALRPPRRRVSSPVCTRSTR